MLRILKPALVLLGIFIVFTGLAYPLLMTGIGILFFPAQANGSLIRDASGEAVGSALIGQDFNEPRYFWGRLSATAGHPYNAATSGGTNFSSLNGGLTSQAMKRIDALRAADPGNHLPVPVDLVTASGSGLDPHISPAAAYYQAGRVARARGLTEEQVNALIAAHTEPPFLGIFGEARVNVLLLNQSLDGLQ